MPSKILDLTEGVIQPRNQEESGKLNKNVLYPLWLENH